MSSALQNRLVGTIIVVALAVIFLPDILDGKKNQGAPTFVSVPQAPERKALVQPQAFPSEKVAESAARPVEIVEETALDDEGGNSVEVDTATPNQEEANVSSLAEQTVVEQPPTSTAQNGGWVIQLGSFRHQKNVRELLDKLENAGYRTFSRPVETSAGRLTKVFVGPDLQRRSLEDAIPHLKELTGLSGKITEFSESF
ncbi:SPOR domain-containing protein [Alteromonas facilis]|uniref:SPOR domain-containing protein n=1 Tax=Alteromonas facilis TaxID=2048004 RepID=UPI000C293FE9|nr:SPOR domain-containing protein [Alteromonas facilis]